MILSTPILVDDVMEYENSNCFVVCRQTTQRFCKFIPLFVLFSFFSSFVFLPAVLMILSTPADSGFDDAMDFENSGDFIDMRLSRFCKLILLFLLFSFFSFFFFYFCPVFWWSCPLRFCRFFDSVDFENSGDFVNSRLSRFCTFFLFLLFFMFLFFLPGLSRILRQEVTMINQKLLDCGNSVHTDTSPVVGDPGHNSHLYFSYPDSWHRYSRQISSKT